MYIAPTAYVEYPTLILDNAQVLDKAGVHSTVRDNAIIKDYAKVNGGGVGDNAIVSEHATIHAGWIGGHAQVYGTAEIYGSFTIITGTARIGGDAVIVGGFYDGSEGEILTGTWTKASMQAKANYKGNMMAAAKDGFALALGPKDVVVYRLEQNVIRVYAYILVLPSHNPCYKAKVVSLSAGKPGWGLGVVAYNAAMYYYKGLTSDRRYVSPTARKVWQRYLAQNGIEHKKFDNVQSPKTPETIDDCEVHSNADELNNVYYMKQKPPGYDAMIRNHKKYGASIDELSILGGRLFDAMYAD